MNCLWSLSGASDDVENGFSSGHVDRLEGRVGINEKLVGVVGWLDTLALHSLVIGQDLALVTLRGEEELHQAVVWCRASLVVGHRLHLLETALQQTSRR